MKHHFLPRLGRCRTALARRIGPGPAYSVDKRDPFCSAPLSMDCVLSSNGSVLPCTRVPPSRSPPSRSRLLLSSVRLNRSERLSIRCRAMLISIALDSFGVVPSDII